MHCRILKSSLSWCEMNRDFGAVQEKKWNSPDAKTDDLVVWIIRWRKMSVSGVLSIILYTPPQTCSSLVCIDKHIIWLCNIREATCKQACKHRSKRIGRLPNGSRKVHSTSSASVSAYPRDTGYRTIIRACPLFPSLSPIVLSGYSVPTN